MRVGIVPNASDFKHFQGRSGSTEDRQNRLKAAADDDIHQREEHSRECRHDETMTVVKSTSRRVGQTTLETSARTCWMNVSGLVLAMICLLSLN